MKMGRPKKDICMTELFKIRFTEEDMQRLRDFANKHNVSMAFVIKNALNNYYGLGLERKDIYEHKET